MYKFLHFQILAILINESWLSRDNETGFYRMNFYTLSGMSYSKTIEYPVEMIYENKGFMV